MKPNASHAMKIFMCSLGPDALVGHRIVDIELGWVVSSVGRAIAL